MSTDEPLFEALKGNICLSGGAIGSDLQWGMNAGRDGQSVIHWSYENHKSDAPRQELIRLTQEQLEKADSVLKRASRTLKRSWPGNRSLGVKSLLRRNWYQVAWSESVYAVAEIDHKGLVTGGTGWAVQMFLDRFAKEAMFEPLPIYVFDQKQEKWFQWKAGWKEIECPPKPSGVWAGIGTRDLNDAGKWAIRNLFGWKKPDEEKSA
jgi:hypothetical protein